MARTHAPLKKLPNFPKVSAEQAARYCSSSVAFILATDMRTVPVKVVRPDEPEENLEARTQQAEKNPLPRPLQLLDGLPLIAHVVRNIAPVFPVCIILVRDGIEQLEEAVATSGVDPSRWHIMPIDYDEELSITAAGQGFDLMTLTKGRLTSILRAARTQADACGMEYFDSVCVFNADQPLIAPRHIMYSQEEFRGIEHGSHQMSDTLPAPKYDIAASWIEWRRVLPVAIERQCLERICAADFPGTCASRQPALPNFQLHDVRFGEEKLNGYLVLPPNNEEWLEQFTLSMPQTIAQAHAYRKALEESGLPEHVMDDAFDPRTLVEDERKAFAAIAPFKPLRAQLDYAIDVLDRIAAATAGREDATSETTAADAADAAPSIVANGTPPATHAFWNAWALRNRLDFPLLNSIENNDRLVYLDSAATTQRPECVLRAQQEHEIRNNSNIWRGYYKLANDCTKAFESARTQIARFIGTKPENLIFTQNTTDSLNRVAQLWGLRHIAKDDLIVCGISEHHSNMLPWFMLRERLGARIEFIPYTPEGRYDLDAYEQLLQQKPKLVSFALIGNTLGIMAPAAHMTQKAHEAGARVCIDAAQAFAHMPIDVSDIGCDFLAFSSHKAYGPMGLGGLYVAPDAITEIEPVALGGGTVSNVTEDDYYLRFAPTAFEAGTPAITQVIGLAKAVEYLQALGMDAIREHDRVLCRYAIDALQTIPGVTVMGDHTGSDGACGSISFHIANMNCLNASKSLGELGVCVRGGAHCAIPLAAHLGTVGSMRVSFGVYSSFDDVDALVLALNHVVDHFAGIEPRP